MTASRFSFPDERPITRINISHIQTEEDLDHMLIQCELFSEPLKTKSIWDEHLPNLLWNMQHTDDQTVIIWV